MRERQIENELVKYVKAAGGMCPKFVAPGFDGMPDRIVLMPEGHIGFVEVKAPGQKPRPLQLKRHAQMRALGYQEIVLDGMDQVPEIIGKIGGK